MISVEKLMEGYFSGMRESHGLGEQNPTTKRYQFSNRDNAFEFVRQLYIFERAAGFEKRITLDGSSVTIELATRNLNEVTNRDLEYSRTAGDIYHDIEGYRR